MTISEAEVIELNRHLARRKREPRRAGTVTLAMREQDFLRILELATRLLARPRVGPRPIECWRELVEDLLVPSIAGKRLAPSLADGMRRTIRDLRDETEAMR